MDRDGIKAHLENLADDFGLKITARQINKFVSLAFELKEEADITLDEILADYTSIAPSDSDDWMEYVDEVSDYVFDIINEGYDDGSEEENEED